MEDEKIVGDYQILKVLGEGTYSTVYQARNIENSKIHALKLIKIQEFDEKEIENILNEVRILASIKHPNIISYITSFVREKKKQLCIVTEFADNGDLYQRIDKFREKNKKIHEEDIWKVIIQILRGLRVLHKNGIIHRDLKSANIFMFKDGRVKIGDMNVAKITQKNTFNTTQTGTPYYSCPEVWEEIPYDSKSDMWSLGILTYEMACLSVPFDAENIVGLMEKIISCKYQAIPAFYSAELATLINVLLQKRSEDRPSSDALLKLPAIQKIENFLYKKHGLLYKREKTSSKKSQQKATKQKMARTIHFDGNFEELGEELKKLDTHSSKRNQSAGNREDANSRGSRKRGNGKKPDSTKKAMEMTDKYTMTVMKEQLQRNTVKRYSRRRVKGVKSRDITPEEKKLKPMVVGKGKGRDITPEIVISRKSRNSKIGAEVIVRKSQSRRQQGRGRNSKDSRERKDASIGGSRKPMKPPELLLSRDFSQRSEERKVQTSAALSRLDALKSKEHNKLEKSRDQISKMVNRKNHLSINSSKIGPSVNNSMIKKKQEMVSMQRGEIKKFQINQKMKFEILKQKIFKQMNFKNNGKPKRGHKRGYSGAVSMKGGKDHPGKSRGFNAGGHSIREGGKAGWRAPGGKKGPMVVSMDKERQKSYEVDPKNFTSATDGSEKYYNKKRSLKKRNQQNPAQSNQSGSHPSKKGGIQVGQGVLKKRGSVKDMSDLSSNKRPNSSKFKYRRVNTRPYKQPKINFGDEKDYETINLGSLARGEKVGRAGKGGDFLDEDGICGTLKSENSKGSRKVRVGKRAAPGGSEMSDKSRSRSKSQRRKLASIAAKKGYLRVKRHNEAVKRAIEKKLRRSVGPEKQ